MRVPFAVSALYSGRIYSPAGVAVSAAIGAGTATAWSVTAVDGRKITATSSPALQSIGTGSAEVRWTGTTVGEAVTVILVAAGSASNVYTLRDTPTNPTAATTGALLPRALSFTVTAATSQALAYGQGYRLEITTAAALTVVVHEVLFDVVRCVASNPATASGFRAFRPHLATEFETAFLPYHGYDSMISESFDSVFADLEGLTLDAYGEADLSYAMVDWSQCETLVYYRMLLDQASWLIPRDWADDPATYQRLCKADYKEALQRFKQNIRMIDRGQERNESEGKSFQTSTILL